MAGPNALGVSTDPDVDLSGERPRITIRPRTPEGQPWGVKETTPQSDWSVKSVEAPVTGAESKSPWYAKMVEPITSYPATQRQMAQEGFDKLTGGLKELGGGIANKIPFAGFDFKTPDSKGNPQSSSVAGGLFDTAVGALDYTASPISAGLRTIVGKPLEENIGLPKEYTEFAAGLLLPYYGLTKTGAAKTAEKILSPTTVGPKAQEAESSIRSFGGTAARDTEQTRAALDMHMKQIAKMQPAERFGLIDYIENRSKGWIIPDRTLQPIADKIRDAFELRKSKLQSLPSTQQQQFIDDYFVHLWKDPAKAKEFLGGGREGTGRFLKERTIPTVADGIKAGLEPVTTDPIDATLRYVQNMDRFIATNAVFDEAKAAGTVKYFAPGKAPAGWSEVKGRLGERGTEQAYAPDEWARVYNNFISKGFHSTPEGGSIYDAAQHTSNAITALELGLSGFHAYTMAQESVISGLTKALHELWGGKPLKAMVSAADSLTKPVRPLLPTMLGNTGKKVEQVYLGRAIGSPDFRKVVDLLEKSGGRAIGSKHAADYQYSSMRSFWDSFRRGSLKAELLADIKTARERPLVGSSLMAAKQVGRIMATVAQPLFEKYIPRIKNAAFYDNMSSWLQMNPKASYEEQVRQARVIWDSIDNRFGEMVQDNIFWNKFLRQSAQLGMRSYSWNLGTVREIGGGVKDVLDAKGLTERTAYVIAAPIVWAANGAAYEYLKTGKPPESIEELVDTVTRGARTGGVDSDTGQPERVRLPGYQNDVMGWYHDWRREAANKASSALRLGVIEPATGKDWRNDPIVDPKLPSYDPEWVKQYFKHVVESMGPISIKNMMRRKRGSNISVGEKVAGFNPQGMRQTAPEAFDRMMEKKHGRERKSKLRYQERDRQRYGGPTE